MGRSKPTFRNYLERFQGDWQPFRRALRRRHQGDFDRLFEKARGHADAAGHLDPTEPRFAILFSMLLAQERELRELRERVEDDSSSSGGAQTGRGSRE